MIKFNDNEWKFIKHCLKDYKKGLIIANYGKEPVVGSVKENEFTGYHKFQLVKSILDRLEGENND